jgi:hypothetical protein
MSRLTLLGLLWQILAARSIFGALALAASHAPTPDHRHEREQQAR